MSDYEKLCEIEQMINNQNNIISERIRKIETKITAIKLAQENIKSSIDTISTVQTGIRKRCEDNEAIEYKRYDIIMYQIKSITDEIHSIVKYLKLGEERSYEQ